MVGKPKSIYFYHRNQVFIRKAQKGGALQIVVQASSFAHILCLAENSVILRHLGRDYVMIHCHASTTGLMWPMQHAVKRRTVSFVQHNIGENVIKSS